MRAAGGFTLGRRRSATLQPGLTKTRRYDGKYRAAYATALRTLGLRTASSGGCRKKNAAMGSAVARRSMRSLAVISSGDPTHWIWLSAPMSAWGQSRRLTVRRSFPVCPESRQVQSPLALRMPDSDVSAFTDQVCFVPKSGNREMQLRSPFGASLGRFGV